MKSIISIVVFICSFQISSLPPSQCRVYLPTDNDNLISQTCLKTPNPDMCISYIQSVPQSSAAADVKALALIMSDQVLKSKAKAAKNIINYIIKKDPKTDHDSLLDCVDYYTMIIEFHIDMQAHDGITGEMPREAAVVAMDDTVQLVKYCNGGLGDSLIPALIETSASVIELAMVTKAIVQSMP